MSDWRHLYPFESHELTVAGRRMHYLDEGAAETILLVHGNPTWSFYWRNIILGLRDKYRLIAPDHIGCGLSEKPGRYEYPFTLQQRMEDLWELIETLDLQNITLMAHDWGGAIGMGVAGLHPERFSRFILCNTGAFRFSSCPRRIAVCKIPVFGDVAVKGFNAFARAATFMAVEKPMDKTVKAGFLAPYDSWRNRTATHEFVRDIPLSKRDRSYETLMEVEHRLWKFKNHPVCLIWGAKDWCFTPEFMLRFQDFYPHAKTHLFDDAGHYVIEDKHAEIVPLVDGFMNV